MGDFFEDLGKKITETAEAVGKKTEEVVEIQKLKNQVRTLERNNERDYMDLGKMIFEKFQNEEVIAPEYTDFCEDIATRVETIIECNKKINELKGTLVCTQCGYTVNDDMQYCPKCGAKIEKPVVAEAECVDGESSEECDCEEKCGEGCTCDCDCDEEKDGE